MELTKSKLEVFYGTQTRRGLDEGANLRRNSGNLRNQDLLKRARQEVGLGDTNRSH